MPWISFVLALGCFALAMKTQSIGLALLCLLLALGLMLWGALSLVSARIQSNSQGGMGLNPVLERQRLRQSAGADVAASPTDSPRPAKARSDDDSDGDGGSSDGSSGD